MAYTPGNTAPAPDDVLERRWRLTPVLAVVALVAALLLGHTLRTHLGLEFSTTAIRTWVTDLGWKGSAGFVALVTLRQLLLMPAFLLLTVGGLAFGAAVGTVLGGAGMFLSAALDGSHRHRLTSLAVPVQTERASSHARR